MFKYKLAKIFSPRNVNKTHANQAYFTVKSTILMNITDSLWRILFLNIIDLDFDHIAGVKSLHDGHIAFLFTIPFTWTPSLGV